MAETETTETVVEETTDAQTEMVEEQGGEKVETSEKTERTESDRVKPDDDWRAKSRKNETRAKKAERELAEARERLKQREEADQSEQEKAVAKAREEGKTEALTEAQVERRADRLEVAATRLAARGIKVGAGDDARTLKFADPDDALVHVERAIRAGDVDEDDIYDDQNKVKTDGLQAALEDILERKPHLLAKADGGAPQKPQGGSDAGRGSSASKTLEEMSPDEHLKQIQNR